MLRHEDHRHIRAVRVEATIADGEVRPGSVPIEYSCTYDDVLPCQQSSSTIVESAQSTTKTPISRPAQRRCRRTLRLQRLTKEPRSDSLREPACPRDLKLPRNRHATSRLSPISVAETMREWIIPEARIRESQIVYASSLIGYACNDSCCATYSPCRHPPAQRSVERWTRMVRRWKPTVTDGQKGNGKACRHFDALFCSSLYWRGSTRRGRLRRPHTTLTCTFMFVTPVLQNISAKRSSDISGKTGPAAYRPSSQVISKKFPIPNTSI